MHGFGPLPLEAGEPVFHYPWESRVLAGALAMSPHLGARFDRFRFLIESMAPADYLNSSYYERWLASLLAGCAEQGIFTNEELGAIERGELPKDIDPRATALPAEAIRNIVTGGRAAVADFSGEALFAVGQAARARNLNPQGHTRLVRYARGKTGEIIADNGNQCLADDVAMGRGENPQRIYTVKFSARELWGETANARDSVCIDLWESYLEHA
jgi:nitrile hydratase